MSGQNMNLFMGLWPWNRVMVIKTSCYRQEHLGIQDLHQKLSSSIWNGGRVWQMVPRPDYLILRLLRPYCKVFKWPLVLNISDSYSNWIFLFLLMFWYSVNCHLVALSNWCCQKCYNFRGLSRGQACHRIHGFHIIGIGLH